MNVGRRFVYGLIGTEDEDAESVWRRMTVSQREMDAGAREFIAAWALKQAGGRVRTTRIVRVTTAGDLMIEGPVALELLLEGVTEAGLDHGDRVFFTMLLRRREWIDTMLTKAAAARELQIIASEAAPGSAALTKVHRAPTYRKLARSLKAGRPASAKRGIVGTALDHARPDQHRTELKTMPSPRGLGVAGPSRHQRMV